MVDPRRQASMIFVLVAALFAVCTHAHETVKAAFESDFYDFGNYYFFSKAASQGYNPYILDGAAVEKMRQGYGISALVLPLTGHSPIFFFLIRWVTAMPYRAASLLWLLLNEAALLASLALIARLVLEEVPDINRGFFIAGGLFFVFAFHPLVENIALGQINFLILLFFILCLYFLRGGRHALAGVMMGLAIIIKPNFAIFLPFFLWKRCYRLAACAFVVVLAAEIAAVFLYGPAIELAYLAVPIRNFLLSSPHATSVNNLSLWQLMSRLSGPGAPGGAAAPLMFPAAAVGCLACAVFAFVRTKGRFRRVDPVFMLEFSLFLLLNFIICPEVHEHQYVFLYLPILLTWALTMQRPQAGHAALFLSAFLCVALRYSLVQFSAFHTGVPAIFTGLKLYGIMAFFFLVASMIRGGTPGIERR